MKNNDVGEFVQLLEDAKQSVQMTGQGRELLFTIMYSTLFTAYVFSSDDSKWKWST